MFPNYNDKYKYSSCFTPQCYANYKKSKTVPDKVILCYQPSLIGFLKSKYKIEKDDGIIRFEAGGETIGVRGGFGVGAPAAGIALEMLVACGAKKIVSIGSAGTLQKDIEIGDFVVCDKAVRDEGTSYHYLEADKFAYASKEITGCIENAFSKKSVKFHKGTSWTTDAPYRETIEEIKAYQNEGILTVEMEASALFAIAKYRSIELGAIFAVSDSLADGKWNPQFKSMRDQLHQLVDLAVEALLLSN